MWSSRETQVTEMDKMDNDPSAMDTTDCFDDIYMDTDESVFAFLLCPTCKYEKMYNHLYTTCWLCVMQGFKT